MNCTSSIACIASANGSLTAAGAADAWILFRKAYKDAEEALEPTSADVIDRASCSYARNFWGDVDGMSPRRRSSERQPAMRRRLALRRSLSDQAASTQRQHERRSEQE